MRSSLATKYNKNVSDVIHHAAIARFQIQKNGTIKALFCRRWIEGHIIQRWFLILKRERMEEVYVVLDEMPGLINSGISFRFIGSASNASSVFFANAVICD